jgi:hypothetical protein
MAYVGNPIDTQNTFQSLVGKRFNGDGSTTAFTLDVAPSSTLDIEVFVGNVRQDPNSAYTLSGTTLTFTGAPPSGTNNIYVVHQAKSVGTITPGANSVGVTELNLSDGSNGQFIKTDGSGTLSFATVDTSGATDSFAITGSTPTLTIGDAGAEDTKIVFDGNAQDYHIGLDDSADDLVIGKGSTLGTTSHIVIDENGHVTKPLQSAFLVTKSSTMDNVGDSEFDVTWQTEVFDRNGDFALNEFTAPVTGIYEMNVQIEGVQLDADSTNAYTAVRLLASNRSFYHVFRNDKELSADASADLQLSTLVDMDANDTCKITMHFANGHTTSDIGTSYTWWSGVLIA